MVFRSDSIFVKAQVGTEAGTRRQTKGTETSRLQHSLQASENLQLLPSVVTAGGRRHVEYKIMQIESFSSGHVLASTTIYNCSLQAIPLVPLPVASYSCQYLSRPSQYPKDSGTVD